MDIINAHLIGMRKHFDLNSNNEVLINVDRGKTYNPRSTQDTISDENMNAKSDIYNMSTIRVTYLVEDIKSATDRFGNNEISIYNLKSYDYRFNGKKYKCIDVSYNGAYKTMLVLTLNIIEA